MSLSLSLTHSSPVRHGRAALTALWSLQVALAGMFLLAGTSSPSDARDANAASNSLGARGLGHDE
jgi:hypothetical protein